MKNLHFIFRMFKRNPFLIMVGLPGLAFGLAAVLLLMVYLRHEISYDQHFATKDRVLRLYNKVTEQNQTQVYGICTRKAYTEIPSKVPEVEAATQILRGWNVNVKSNKNIFPSLNLLYADPAFFRVFGLHLLSGDTSTALDSKNSVVLTRSVAQKIFGKTDCVGQVVTVSDQRFIVTGVVEDLPHATHFSFDILASMETIDPGNYSGGLEYFTYFLIGGNANIEKAGSRIASLNDELLKPWGENFNLQTESGTELLGNLHLRSKVDFDLSDKADFTQIISIAGIAIFILIIALVNYINLYVLHGEKRIAEIASRKSLGADRRALARLFYTETGLIGAMAFLIALILIRVAQPYFEELMQSPVRVSDLYTASGLLLILVFLAFLILVSGAYPSFYLSRVNLVNGLKGKSDQLKRKSNFSTVTVLVQFAITIFLLSSLSIVYAQLRHLKNLPLGFSPEHVVGLDGFNSEIKKNFKSIEGELARFPFIENIGVSRHDMGGGSSGQGIKKYGDPGEYLSINQYRVQPGFAETMKLQLVDGRFFRKTGDGMNVILNEAAAKLLGLSDPVGSQVQMHGRPMEVIGVVKDFYYEDRPGELVAPLVLTDYSDEVSVLYLRLKSEFTPEQQQQVTAVLKQYDPDFIFSYFLLTNTYSSKFDKEQRMMKLISAGSFLAILISFIGLMALSVMNVNRRTKEIGIRKVSGSSVAEVMVILLRQTVVLIFISCFIAAIAGFWVMQHWLSHYMDRISLHAGYFLISGLAALLIALMSVSWQSWKAATRNPVEALRYE
ncbi:ABC transporter permease [Gaoshiqia sp. Z1-71]|uniref:ABC transporter permease n=1 Tax=Gaoshiqia hydrogeniformans TaxID=3290090 RepID=UPI003BF84287